MVPLGHMSITRQLPAAVPRPPTPPRESDKHDSRSDVLFGRVFSKDTAVKSSSNITPSSSAESPNQLSGTTRKKVEWDDEATKSPINQPLPNSGERKPIKSILKPYNVVNVSNLNLGSTSKLSPAHAYANLAAMLESIAQQLAGEDRNSKMDAYTTLSGTIKAYDNVPDVRALREKMGLLQQFMKRDLAAKTTTGSLDTPLIINDLILLSSFLHKPAIADLLTSDFCAYLVDHAIKTFEDPGMSKDVVKHLMFIIVQQSFPAKIMNVERVGRLISALHEIENYVKGKSIITGRLNIYRNLIRKSRACMIVNSDWIEDLFSDTLSSLKDTRTLAIDLGLEASLVLGTESRVSRAVMELFQRERKDDKLNLKFGEYFAKRMHAMVHKKQEGGSSSIPQIWSIAILFLRCRPRQLEQWAFMNDWLKVIQECFNCSDQQTKLEANLAWNRLVFAIRPDEKTSPNIITMLCRPLLEQLKRKGKSTGKARRATLSSVCVLLYYSLRPNSSSTELDQYWDQYVVQIVSKTLTAPNVLQSAELARHDLIDACLILRGLFDSTTPRLWKETRAMECNTIDTNMEASELPALDSKWLRKRASRVFAVLNPLLEQLYWDLSEDEAPITTLWNAYILSIASPAAKEVKVSNETMACVACIFNFLYRIWHTGPKNIHSLPAVNGAGAETFLESFAKIALSAIDGLGVLPFTEKLLSIGGQDTFVVISTPSHRPRNSRGDVQCPLHHLFVLLTKTCPGVEYDEKFSMMVRRIIYPFISTRTSSKSQMEFIKELLQLLPGGTDFNEPCKLIWQVLADLATRATDTRDENGSVTNKSIDQPLGVDYRNALEILEMGMNRSPRIPLPGWRSLFEALVTSATLDAGDGGRAIAIIEPLARAITAKSSKTATRSDYGLAYCRMIISRANYPRDRQALDAARRRLWGAATGVQKPSAFDPYTELYACLKECLETSYASFNKDQTLEYSDVLSATTALLSRCPDALLYSVYLKLQNGIACWILDENLKLSGGNVYSQAITTLWAKVCSQLPSMRNQYSHSTILSNLEPLLLSGLESRHRAIVNAAIRLWNSIFANCQENLEYPPRIKGTLLRLHPVADLQLPCFPVNRKSEGSEEHRQRTFVDSQDESSNLFEPPNLGSILQKHPISHLDPARTQRSTPYSLNEVKRSREKTPELGKRDVKKRVPTPKLRHDDSQIQFEAIESSPIAEEVLESQLLTDRQKEVKERQQADATMFPDLRSSPRSNGDSFTMELPLHRSASKTHPLPSPVTARQTTPILILQAEEDDFVNSSPTPTRVLDEGNTSEPPSSPPEVVAKQQITSYDDDCDIPSSPPEIIEDQGDGNTTSLDPSAQIDPYAAENIHPLSTFDDTPGELDGSKSLEPSPAEGSSKTKRGANLTTVVRPGHSDPESKPSQAIISAMGSLSTPPPQDDGDTAVTRQAPTTPIFHDALTSPVSSDGQTGNTEVFEDAVSSPRLSTEKTKTNKASSPISDFDESSMLRLVKEFDQGSGRQRRSIRFSAGKENLLTKTLESNDSAYPATPSEGLGNNSTGDVPDLAALQADEIDNAHQGLNMPSSKGLRSSSLPSLIPETPGIGAAFLETDEGEELDPHETIIVETPDDYEEYKVPRRRRSKGLLHRIRHMAASSTSKKRKHDDTSEDQQEVPDSQDLILEERAVSLKRISPFKRRRGRPQRPSRLSSQTDMSPEAEPEPAQSFSWVDVNDSIENLEFDSTTDIFTSIAKKLSEGHNVSPPDAVGTNQLGGDGEEEEVATTTGEMRVNIDDLAEDSKDVVIEAIADTTFDDSDILESSVTAMRHKLVHEKMDIMDRVEPTAIPSVELSVTTNARVETEVKKEVPTMQDMKQRLQSLINDLATASLTREEVNVFEDMFMDAKEKLYGAARRGRAGS